MIVLSIFFVLLGSAAMWYQQREIGVFLVLLAIWSILIHFVAVG